MRRGVDTGGGGAHDCAPSAGAERGISGRDDARAAPTPRERPVSATLYYLLVTLLLVLLIGGMAAGLALGGRLDDLDD